MRTRKLVRSPSRSSAMNDPPLKFIDPICSFRESFFFAATKRHDDEDATSSRLPEGGIHPGEALCSISSGVPETGYSRIAGEVVHS